MTEQPTLDEAIAAGEAAQRLVEQNADEAWLAACERIILDLQPGATFLAEDVVGLVEAGGYTTSNRKAVGPVMARLGRQGRIEQTGMMQRARTSHAQMKPQWRRAD